MLDLFEHGAVSLHPSPGRQRRQLPLRSTSASSSSMQRLAGTMTMDLYVESRGAYPSHARFQPRMNPVDSLSVLSLAHMS